MDTVVRGFLRNAKEDFEATAKSVRCRLACRHFEAHCKNPASVRGLAA